MNFLARRDQNQKRQRPFTTKDTKSTKFRNTYIRTLRVLRALRGEIEFSHRFGKFRSVHGIFAQAAKTSTAYLLIFLLVAPAQSTLAQERLERVTLAIPVHALSQLPAFVASRFGLFREEGLDVQIIQMRTALV